MSACIIPTLKYADAGAAIEWLCKAFGFEKHLVVPGDNGSIAHAQLTFGPVAENAASPGRCRYPKPLHCRYRRRCALHPCPECACACADCHASGRPGLWRTSLFVPRSGRLFVEFRQLRSVGIGQQAGGMRSVTWLAAAAVLLACVGCSTTNESEQSSRDYIVVFQLDTDAGGNLQRLAVYQLLDKQNERPVMLLPSADFVGKARDTLKERAWPVTYDQSGRIKATYVRCLMIHSEPEVPACD